MTSAPNRDEIVEQLNRIIASSDFTAGPRVQRFLTHLVMEELDGRGEGLRGTALAMDVFGRGGDFDPNNDPVVRIEAVKLRKAIEHFYLTSGVEDRIVIEVPKGQYRPVFASREFQSAAPAERRRRGLPTLAILQFDGSSSERAALYKDGLPEEIALELARFGQIRVISGWHASSGEDGSAPTAILDRADYVLRGNVREAGNALRVSVQLSRLPGETLVWSERFRIAADDADPFAVQEDIARQCATRLADAYGAVSEDLSAQYSGRPSEDAGVFEALLAFHAHMRISRMHSLREFRELAEQSLRENPSSGLAHALVALGLIEAASLGEMTVAEVLEPGRIHAEKAVALAPNCQEALFAAAAFAHSRQDMMRYRTLIRQALDANPNGTLLYSIVGGWFSKAGDIEEGIELVEEARRRNPLLPAWTSIALALKPLLEGDFLAASDMVRDVDARDVIYDWLLIGTAHVLAERPEEARAAFATFTRLQIDPMEYANSIPMSDALAKLISNALTKLQGLS